MTRPWLSLLLALLLPIALGAGDGCDLGVATPTQQLSERRVALVIGNGAYAFGALKNPPNDARAVAAKLTALGFSVTLLGALNHNTLYLST